MQHYLSIITLTTALSLPVDGTISWGRAYEFVDKAQFTLKICDVAQKRNAQINIVHRNGNEETSTIIFGKINWNVLHECLSELPHVVRSLDLLYEEPERFSSSLSIFFITSPSIASTVIKYINPNQPWKQAHRYLFVWLLPDLNQLRDFFLQVWYKNILHAVAAVDSQRVFTFEPFTTDGFRLKRIGEEHPSYFYDKLQNFYHYQLRVTMFTNSIRAMPLADYRHKGYKGVDGRVADALVRHLNATALYITPRDNQTYGSLHNGTFSGSLKDIHSGLTHIGFNMRYTLDHVKQHIEELYPYQRRFLYLVVPAAEMKPEYMNFVQTFSTSVWRLVILNFCIIVALFMLLQHMVEQLPNKTNRELPPKHWHWYELVEMLFKAQLGEPVEGFSRISSLRQFLMSWILFGYVLTSMYFAKLESSFIYPAYEAELDNLEDLVHLKLPIHAYATVFEAIKVSLHPNYYQLIISQSVHIPLNVSEFALSLTQKNANVALIVHDELAKKVLAKTYNDAIKRASFHIVKEYLRSLTSSYVLTKGSPFTHKFQTIVSAFHEHGFISHWMHLDVQPFSSYSQKSDEFFEDLEDNFDLNTDGADGADAYSQSSQPVRNKKIVLNIDVLQGAFYLWLGGILISSMGFLAEWWYWWRTSRHYENRGSDFQNDKNYETLNMQT